MPMLPTCPCLSITKDCHVSTAGRSSPRVAALPVHGLSAAVKMQLGMDARVFVDGGWVYRSLYCATDNIFLFPFSIFEMDFRFLP
jgi:hypothetical protein